MKNKLQIRIVISLLLLIGVGTTIYKVKVLGFSLSPETRETVWTVEAVITFEAEGGPVRVQLNSPDNRGGLEAIDTKAVANEGYRYAVEEVDGVKRAVWTTDRAQGPQKIYYQLNIYRRGSAGEGGTQPPALPAAGAFSGPLEVAASALVKQAAAEGATPVDQAKALLRLLNSPGLNDNAALLLEKAKASEGTLALARNLLAVAGIPARVMKGISLNSDKKKQKIRGYIEIYDGSSWVLLDPKTAEAMSDDAFLLWQKGDESLLEVEGGHGSKIRFSVVSSRVMANKAAIGAGLHQGSVLVDFSIYTLPLADQNTFKLLLLIPFGALVVVVLRNLVGIRTSGTFMPILIALTFLQTTLLAGLFLFIVIVGIGLLLRSYLSRLNLLLVPRISAVLVFVIFIFLAVSVTSHKLGSDFGLTVTYFPMIIISWTIERMCILWEEEGPKEVLVQGGGSLFTASLVYLLLKNKFIAHLTYSFPELLLVLLAVILTIGSYSGYRLTELRRFEPMAAED